jgi:hypothetical protein
VVLPAQVAEMQEHFEIYPLPIAQTSSDSRRAGVLGPLPEQRIGFLAKVPHEVTLEVPVESEMSYV